MNSHVIRARDGDRFEPGCRPIRVTYAPGVTPARDPKIYRIPLPKGGSIPNHPPPPPPEDASMITAAGDADRGDDFEKSVTAVRRCMGVIFTLGGIGYVILMAFVIYCLMCGLS